MPSAVQIERQSKRRLITGSNSTALPALKPAPTRWRRPAASSLPSTTWASTAATPKPDSRRRGCSALSSASHPARCPAFRPLPTPLSNACTKKGAPCFQGGRVHRRDEKIRRAGTLHLCLPEGGAVRLRLPSAKGAVTRKRHNERLREPYRRNRPDLPSV